MQYNTAYVLPTKLLHQTGYGSIDVDHDALLIRQARGALILQRR